jgi:hypothetical protein
MSRCGVPARHDSSLRRVDRVVTPWKRRCVRVLVCLSLAGAALAPAPSMAAADAPCARYAGTPERVRGGDDNLPDRLRAGASALSCPDDVWVQITACLQIQTAGGWADVECRSSPRTRITRFTRGARGEAVSLDVLCVPGVMRTHVTGGEGREPVEWDSGAATIACNVHDTPVDTTPPQASIVSGPTGLTRATSPSFGLASTEAGSTFECRLDAPVWTGCSNPARYDSLPDGPYTFRVRATDLAGNVGTQAMRSFTVDTTPPAVVIESGPSGTVTATAAGFTLSTEPGASLECRLDSAAWSACTSPADYPDLAEGEHGFGARATDAAGNLGAESTRTWIVASTHPQPGSPQIAGTSPPTAPAAALVGAPRAATGPVLRLSAHRRPLTATRLGVVEVRLGAVQQDVSGTLSLRAGVLLGRRSFTARAGQAPIIRVRLSRTGFAALRRRGHIAVRATVVLRDAAGNAGVTVFAFTLKAARSRS